LPGAFIGWCHIIHDNEKVFETLHTTPDFGLGGCGDRGRVSENTIAYSAQKVR